MADVVKYGIQIPNRVFVGGVAFDTKEDELKEFFSQYGKVKECKIIKDNQSISRGFAFVTFECKHDAIQTQQLGTVFFKQKKLNLGPAIRQKGVVFNGAAEFENEPVLSTGVYVHPSGYSYTVAPNGVWYFHNPDGSPRPRQRGTPAMSYSPALVKTIQQTTQEYQASNPPNVPVNQVDSATYECETSTSFSLLHSNDSAELPFQQTHMVPNQPHGPSYVHHAHSTIGASNIHVAFQNMSISTHPAPPLPPQIRFANPSPPSPPFTPHSHSNVQPMNGPLPHAPVMPVQYARVNEIYMPCYAQNNSTFEAHVPHTSSNCQFQVPMPTKQEYYSMLPNGLRETHMYPLYNPYHPTVVYPTPLCNNSSANETSHCFKKMQSPRNAKGMKGFSNHYSGYNEKDVGLKLETKCP